jgi:hypothetical protein
MNDQTIRLILQTQGQESIEALKKSTANYKALLEETVAAFARGDLSAEEFQRAQQKLGSEYERQTQLLGKLETAQAAEAKAAAEAAQAAGAQANALDRLGITLTHVTSTAQVASSRQLNLNQMVTQGSFAIQDFTAAGGDLGQKLNSMTNNVQMIANAFGGYGIAAGVAIAAGVSLYRNWDELMRAFQAKTPIDDAARSVDGLEKALNKHREELEKLRERQTLTNDEMARYVDLIKTSAVEEARLDAARAAKASREAPSDEDKKRAAIATGVRDKVTGQQLEKDVRAYIEDVPGIHPEDFQKETEAFIQQFLAGKEKQFNFVRDHPGAFDRTGIAFDEAMEEPGRQARAKLEAEAAQKAKADAKKADADAEAATRRIDEEIEAQEEKRQAQVAARVQKEKAAEDSARHRQEAERTGDAKTLAGAIARETPIDEFFGTKAAAMARRGASETQIAEMLAPQITRAIKQIAPQIPQAQAMGAGTELAKQAAQNADAKLFGLSQQNVGLTGQAVGVMGQFAGELGQMTQQQAAMKRQLDELSRQSRTRSQSLQSRTARN